MVFTPSQYMASNIPKVIQERNATGFIRMPELKLPGENLHKPANESRIHTVDVMCKC